MEPQRRQPDPAARLISHLIVGLALGALFGKKQGPLAFCVAAIVGIYAHEQLDAPVAGVLSEFGI
jgi:hypothetical protein